jgi:hypothetical protein
LIDQEDPPKEKERINIFNWLRPFTSAVWMLTFITVVISGFCHQLLEWLNGERRDRSQWQWFADNFYLSWLNITQNYEYAPNSFSTRVFGISMGIWALVMTATYTANLASLLVEAKEPPFTVDSIEQAVFLEIPVCTYGNTNADIVIKRRYEKAIRIPFESELEAYEALRRGECGLVASYLDNWLGYQQDARYNPQCDLNWVGRTVETIKSGFAAKADAGYKCTSLVRDVVNLHLNEIISAGILADAWERHRLKMSQEFAVDCVADNNNDVEKEDSNVLRSLQALSTNQRSTMRKLRRLPLGPSSPEQPRRRKLKGGGGGGTSAAATSGDGEGERLTVEQMAGIFIVHYLLMVVAIGISLANNYRLKRRRQRKSKMQDEPHKVCFREHGPIIGHPPPVNTYVQETSPTNIENEDSKDIRRSNRTAQTDSMVSLNDLSTSGGWKGSLRNISIIQQLHDAVQATNAALQESHSELLDRQNEIREQMKSMMSLMLQIQSASGNHNTRPNGPYAVDYDLVPSGAKSEEKKSHQE